MSRERNNRTTINDLPLFIIDYILSKFNFHQILQLRLISKYWDSIIKNYLFKADKNFVSNLANYRVQWVPVKELIEDRNKDQSYQYDNFFPERTLSSKSKKLRAMPRFSPRIHYLSCYTNGNMYVYGGCISSTTICNDLWRFNVSSKKWLRIIAEGTLPLPRLFSSFTLYNCEDEISGRVKQYIVLFGGIVFDHRHFLSREVLSHMLSLNFSFNVNIKPLKTIHFFDIEENRWIFIDVKGDIQLQSCYHSASIVGDQLIVFNGLNYVNDEKFPNTKVFIFDLKKHYWWIKNTIGCPKMYNIQLVKELLVPINLVRGSPPKCFTLDDHHTLFVGDSLYPRRHVFPVVSLLKRIPCHQKSCRKCEAIVTKKSKKDFPWQWIPIEGFKSNELASKCGDVCKIGNILVYLSIKNGIFKQRKLNIPYPNPQSLIDRRNLHERRRENLNYYRRYFERKINNLNHVSFEQKTTLQIHVLDISKVLTEAKISEMNPEIQEVDYTVAPNPFTYYTLAATPESLVLFGGECFTDQLKGDWNVVNKTFLLVSKAELNL